MSEFICGEHGSDACADCAKEFKDLERRLRIAEAKLRVAMEALEKISKYFDGLSPEAKEAKAALKEIQK